MAATVKIFNKKTSSTSQADAEKGSPVVLDSKEQVTIDERRKTIDNKVSSMPKEFGGRTKEKGLEPTRYDDWELKGRCVDF